MAYDVTATLKQVASHVSAGRYAHAVVIGEPVVPPEADTDKIFVAIYMLRDFVAALSLNGGTIELHLVMLRCYYQMLQEPVEGMELGLANAVSNIKQDLVEDADLGANIRNIDVGGQYGQSVATEYGHLDQSGILFRVADIMLPLIVDDSATAAL
jgi:hypothetical protein